MLYNSIDEAWRSLIWCLLKCPDHGQQSSRDGDVVGEIIGYKAIIDAATQRTFLCNERRRLSRAYAAAETLWYLSGTDETRMLERYAPSYKHYAQDGRAYGAYGPRIMPQLPRVIQELRTRSQTRQSVISVWDKRDLDAMGSTPDMPCTLTLQYVLRDSYLHAITSMRSNDAWKGFPYDVFAFTCLQRVVAAHLDARVGLYHHHVGSMHLYSRNAEAAEEACGCALRSHAFDWRLDDTLTTCGMAVHCERAARTDGVILTTYDALGDMTRWLVDQCAAVLNIQGDGRC